MAAHEELIDYEDDQDVIGNGASLTAANGAVTTGFDGDDKDKKNFSGIHSTGFRSVGTKILVKYPISELRATETSC